VSPTNFSSMIVLFLQWGLSSPIYLGATDDSNGSLFGNVTKSLERVNHVITGEHGFGIVLVAGRVKNKCHRVVRK
jgi:hypothetical protein